MVSGVSKDRALKILFFVGLVIAILSALENRIDWIASFCGIWGDGCRETAKVTLFHLPIAVWGIIYYVVLILFSFVLREWLFYVVMAGVGVEMTLVAMMVEMKWACVFCILNFIVVALVLIVLYENKRIWQAVSIAVVFFMASDHLLSQKTYSQVKPSAKAPKPSVVAQVGDDMIYEQELNESLSAQIYKLEKQIYDLKKDRLNFMIDSILIALDAENKGISPEVHSFKLYNEGVDVADSEVEQYIISNPGIETNWKGREHELRERVKQYLKNLKIQEKVDSFTRPLKKKYSVEIYLDSPALPLTSISRGDSPSQGPEDADVVVFEFSDYQCPSCRKAHPVSVDMRKEFKGKVQWVFKDYPLNSHKDAWVMAQAARCADDQGKFWEYQDFLYEFNGHPDIETFKGFARQLELDMDQFSGCLESEKYKETIEKVKQEGKDAGVNSTPTFVINGRLRPGYISEKQLRKWIKQELANKKR